MQLCSILAVAALVVCSGCAHEKVVSAKRIITRAANGQVSATTLNTPTPAASADEEDARCDKLRSKQRGLDSSVLALGVLTGGGGISTAIPSDTVPKYVLGGITLALGVTTTVLGVLLKGANSDLVHHGCKTDSP